MRSRGRKNALPAQPVDGPVDALCDGVRFSREYALDGARVRVRREGDELRGFTRPLHDVTASVPGPVIAARAVVRKRCVVDNKPVAEVDGLDRVERFHAMAGGAEVA